MIEDKELDNLIEERKQQTELIEQSQSKDVVLDESTYVANSMHTQFAKTMDAVKRNVLDEASTSDEQFKQTIKDNIKDAAVKLTEVEQAKASYIKQQVGYESTKLKTKGQQEEHKQQEDIWSNKQKRREYHYLGVKPIMLTVGITEPMNLVFLYLLAIILFVPFLACKLLRGTLGALLAGTEDGNRSKAAKGFIWTVLAILTAVICFGIIYLILKWLGLDIFANI